MANRLITETSPYLLQHAHNPVDWYPWGDEAFEEAKRRGVPVLLSIGYSACHWCHVMERESFANPVVAARINTLFVPVKVDREERPDVDDIYMRAVQAFNRGHGGWPMTVFLTPDRQPFFGGTYFPPVARGGLPGFVDVLSHVSDVWRKQPDEVERITGQVAQLLGETTAPRAAARTLARDWLDQVAQSVTRDFDAVHGGFGDAPKFPSYGTLAVLLAHHRRAQDAPSLRMVTHTLDGMAKGGLYDLVGGGFARYSVDAEWRVPHFEKMLYDNAQLVPLYVDAFKVTGDPHYARIARETVDFILREMALPDGGFAASFDADSPSATGEVQEGAYYAFTPAQLRELLGPDDGSRAAFLLGVTPDGTFEHGASVVRLDKPLERLADSDRAFLEVALPKIRAGRDQRARPARDDKRIASWNALMISALARGSAIEPAWAEAAVQAARFLLAQLRVDGQWRRIYMNERPSAQLAFVDDHANLLVAFLDLYEATFDPAWLAEAEAVAAQIIARFWDEESGSLFLASHDQPSLIARGRPTLGGAEPSPIGTTALGFVRLGKLLGRQDLLDRSEALLRSAQFALGRAARTLGSEAVAGAWLAEGGAEIALAGDRAAIEPLLAVVRGKYLPFTVLAQVDVGQPALPWTEGKTAIGGRATAYVCEGFSCLLPTPEPETLAAQLEERMAAPVPSVSATPEVRVRAPALPADPAAWLNTDAPLTLDKLRGQIVVLDFWTFCCINCLHVLPELAAVEARYAGQPVAVIGVHCAKFPAEEVLENVRRAIARHGITHPVVNDPAHAVWDEYAVRSWPTLVVLDATGRIAFQKSGEVDSAALIEVIDRLLEEARSAGTLAAPLPAPAPATAPDTGLLRYPGKIHVWPDSFDQEGGAEVFSADRSARVYVSDTGHHRILECTIELDDDAWPTLVLQRTFGSGDPGLVDGPSGSAQFRGPQGVRRHGTTLYVADTENHALRAVDLLDGTVRTLAGTGRRGTKVPTTEGMANPTSLDLRSPWDVEVMTLRTQPLVFVAMAGAHQLWVYASGHIGIHVGAGNEDHIDGPAAQAALAQPSGLSLLGRYLLFVDAETSSIRAADLQSHQVMTVMGRGLFDFGDRDGPADVARLQHPLAITYAEDVVYVADTYNHKVKTVALTDGRTTTLAGGPGELCEPGGIARAGALILVADTGNHRIRALDPETAELRDVPIR